jgi:hypothetical protein
MTTFGLFMGVVRFQWDSELDCGVVHRDSREQGEGYGNRD